MRIAAYGRNAPFVSTQYARRFLKKFGIITIATEVAEDGGQVAREKPIFWLNSQCFEHYDLGNLNLFRI